MTPEEKATELLSKVQQTVKETVTDIENRMGDKINTSVTEAIKADGQHEKIERMETDLKKIIEEQKDARSKHTDAELQKRHNYEMTESWGNVLADHSMRSFYEKNANQPVTPIEQRDAYKLHQTIHSTQIAETGKEIKRMLAADQENGGQFAKLIRATSTTTDATNVGNWTTNQVDETIYTKIERDTQIASLFSNSPIARGRSGVQIFQETQTGFLNSGQFWEYNNIGKLTQNASIVQPSINPLAGGKTVQTVKFGGFQEITGEVNEDVIANGISRLTTTLPRAAARMWDLSILNGDSTNGTDIGTLVYTVPANVTAQSTLRQIKGLRSHARGNANSMVNASGGAFSITGFRGVYGGMDKYANPQDNYIVTNYSGWLNMLNLSTFQTVDLVGRDRATVLTGAFGSLDGRPVVISDEFFKTNSAGLFDTATAANNSLDSYLVLNPSPFRIYTSRTITMETDRNILTDVNQFVLSTRAVFERVTPDQSDAFPVGYYFNVGS